MKQVVFKIEEELFKKAKIRSIRNDQNMTEYLTELIKKDLKMEEREKRNCE